MSFCPECGKQNPDEARFCQYCGTNFPEMNGSAQQAPPGPAQAQPGQYTAPPYQAPPGPGHQGGPQAGPQPGYQPVPQQQQQVQVKNTILAGVLGFINFGLGAFYCGQTGKGIALLVITLLFGSATWAINPGLGLIFGCLFAYDSYKIAQRINNGETVGPWQFF